MQSVFVVTVTLGGRDFIVCGYVRNSTMLKRICRLRLGTRGREMGHCKNEAMAYRYARERLAVN